MQITIGKQVCDSVRDSPWCSVAQLGLCRWFKKVDVEK